ncbi:MAG TPA: SRPBCC family protein [Methylomirabilota bacterium]|nr:SRPBCC family protein [Methylomirabilota bacterium]
MADYILERRVWLPRARSDVFEFFADPENLARVQPRWARPRWIAAPPRRLAVGAVLDFRVPAVPSAWRIIVREFDPPHRFVAAQVRGPFARWEHRHRFLEGPARAEAGAPAGTWVEDRVTYRLPLGVLGRVAHALGACRRIRRAFDYRDRRLADLLSRLD